MSGHLTSLSGSDSSHTHPSNTVSANDLSTSSHPGPASLDPTTHDASQGGHTASNASAATELPRLEVKLRSALRQFPDFPTPGVLFEDIMPLFASPELHEDLIRAQQIQVQQIVSENSSEQKSIDVIVGLESRGFLFGPTLALRLGAAFVPVRKKGKLPGPCETESFEKEYGADHFQMQSDAVKPGEKVLIIDDIIATGGSAAAAGKLVRKLGGDLLGYMFMMELDFLKGREKLDAPVYTLFSGQHEALSAATQ